MTLSDIAKHCQASCCGLCFSVSLVLRALWWQSSVQSSRFLGVVSPLQTVITYRAQCGVASTAGLPSSEESCSCLCQVAPE